MKKINKLALLSALPLSAAAIPLIAASCNSINLKRYVFEYSSSYSPQAFGHDASRSYGSYIGSAVTQHISVGLLRYQSLNEPEVFHHDIKNAENQITDIKTYITKPSYVVKKLALASAIVVTDKDGKTSVFDSDDYDMSEQKAPNEDTIDGKVIGHFPSPSVFLKSKNNRSINSDEFLEKLKTAKKVQFVVRKGVFWVDQNGNKTKYKVQAKDFYYSWLRTRAINGTFRHGNGGSEQLDAEAQEALSDPSSSAFTEKEGYSNEYLFTLFGIDYEKFEKEEEFIQKVETDQFKGDEAITFQQLGQSKTDFEKFINATIIKDYTFMPAPSQYIDEANASSELPVYDYIGNKTEKSKKFEEKLRAIDKKSIVSKVGAYWYGLSLKNTLFIGPYYILPQKGQELRLKKNQHYYDQEWAKSNDTVEEIFQIYNSDIEPDIFTRRSLNQYKQGRLSQISFTDLKPNQQSEILKNSREYGLRFNRAINKTSPFYRSVLQPFVKPLPDNNDVSFYGFNDAFAKIMFGGTRDELKKGTNDPKEYISGTGLIFRTLFNAAINWNELAAQATNGQGIAWLAKVADGSEIGGKDQSNSKIKTPYDVREEINSLFALKSDGTGKLKFGDKLNEDLSPSENDEAVKNISTKNDRLKSAGFETIKQEMEKLIQEFDKKNPELSGKEFSFQYIYPFINISAGYKEAFENISKTFEQLHPRLKLSVFHTTNKDDPKFQALRTGGANATELVAWGYDYDAIGSGYDGLSWNANLIPTLTWIAANEENKKNEILKQNYPKIHALAKAIVEWSEKENTKWIGSVPFKELHLVKNDFKGKSLPYTTSLKFEKKNGSTTYELVKGADGKPEKWKSENGKQATEANSWTAQFWLNYVSSITNEEAKELMKEFTSFFNVDFSYNIFKQKNEFGRSLIQKHFIVPDDSPTGVSMYSDWKIKLEK